MSGIWATPLGERVWLDVERRFEYLFAFGLAKVSQNEENRLFDLESIRRAEQ